MSTILEIHTAVWDFRRQYNAWWATPNPDDCLRYAFTEAGELMDAYLRSQRPDDARNNVKLVEIDHVKHELADVAIMLVSAMPKLQKGSWAPLKHPTLDDICFMVGCCLDDVVESWNNHSLMDAITYSERYASTHHIDLLAQVRDNLEQIKRKHVPESEWK
jgi:NTP pyrophosphatase (non-canonical NTP hydrolase)